MRTTPKALRPAMLRLLVMSLCIGITATLSPKASGASSVTLAWDANSETNLAGYKVHYGSASGQYPNVVDVGNVVTATVSNLNEGNYFFVVTAYDSEGLESDPSNEVSYWPTGTPPTISGIADQTIPQGERVGPLAFTVADQETPSEQLFVTARSSNLTLVPVANIRMAGTGRDRTILVIPRLTATGTAIITLSVTDGNLTSERHFGVTVRPLSEMPKCPLTVLTNGIGTVSPRLNGSDLIVGKTYTLLAQPGANQLFSGWSGSVTASTNRLTFLMQSNLVLQANFVPDPFLPRRGSYNGLFYETNEVRHESSGFLSLRLSPRGVFSANLKLRGRNLPFTGKFDLEGRVTRTLRRPGTNALAVDLYLDLEQAESRLHGQVSDGIWSAQIVADRAIFYTTTNHGAYSGRYTMAIPGNSDPASGPTGSGFGIITVSRKGDARLYGQLADGRPISQSVPLAAQGYWPLYVALYSGNGSILSWIAITNTPMESLQGLLSWIKPALPVTRYYPNGFTNESSVFGSYFRSTVGITNRVLDVTNALLVLGGGNLSGIITNAVTLAAPNKMLNSSTNRLAVGINPSSGMLHGSFVDPATRRTHQFRGVILQQHRLGTGFVSGTNATGFVELEPATE